MCVSSYSSVAKILQLYIELLPSQPLSRTTGNMVTVWPQETELPSHTRNSPIDWITSFEGHDGLNSISGNSHLIRSSKFPDASRPFCPANPLYVQITYSQTAECRCLLQDNHSRKFRQAENLACSSHVTRNYGIDSRPMFVSANRRTCCLLVLILNSPPVVTSKRQMG
jgi:hypothetical protein